MILTCDSICYLFGTSSTRHDASTTGLDRNEATRTLKALRSPAHLRVTNAQAPTPRADNHERSSLALRDRSWATSQSLSFLFICALCWSLAVASEASCCSPSVLMGSTLPATFETCSHATPDYFGRAHLLHLQERAARRQGFYNLERRGRAVRGGILWSGLLDLAMGRHCHQPSNTPEEQEKHICT